MYEGLWEAHKLLMQCTTGFPGFSPEMFVSVVKVYTNVHEARGENL